MALLTLLYRRWRLRSLRAKLLWPVVGLMLLAMLGSAATFVIGTTLTRDQLLAEQTAADAGRVQAGMAVSVEAATNGANLLAQDPEVLDAMLNPRDLDTTLSTLNRRGVVIRDRLGLDLVQIYTLGGIPRTNLVMSSLYRESSLLQWAEPGSTLVQVVDGRMLLLSRATMSNAAGDVVTAIDLEAELHRLASRYRLSADLGLSAGEAHVSTRADLPFDLPAGRTDGHYVRRLPVTLGQTAAEVVLTRRVEDINQVANTGLFLMLGSMLLTTLLLVALSVLVTRAIARPIHQLSVAAEALAQGDMSQQVRLAHLSPFSIGTDDEIGILATTFNRMVDELSNLYDTLEAQVRARTQELAEANARLQELDLSKNNFIQNVSHELRTPLAIIRGYAESLDTGLLGDVPGEQRGPVAIIARRSRMMSELVDGITALLEVEARKSPQAPVCLTELAENAIRDFATLAEQNRLELKAEISPCVPRVLGVEPHLRRVFDNLINNAIKFTPAGGAITLKLARRNGCALIIVSDTGIGIPADKQAHVFECFYQVDGSAQRRYGGSGLGLALVKEIVQAHGGQVTLESEPEQGSTFTVALPITGEDQS